MPLFLILIQDKPVKPGEELAVSSSGEDEAGPEEGTGVFSSGIDCRGRLQRPRWISRRDPFRPRFGKGCGLPFPRGAERCCIGSGERSDTGRGEGEDACRNCLLWIFGAKVKDGNSFLGISILNLAFSLYFLVS